MELTKSQKRNALALYHALHKPETKTSIRDCIHTLSYSLFSHVQPNNMADKYFSAVNRFLVISSMQLVGSFKRASQITQIIAALMYSIRTTMLHESEILMHTHDISILQ